MRRTKYFLPTLKENPSEAKIVSHQLMLRAGMIHQQSAGIYSWLPMGTTVLQNVAQIIREEQNRIGAQEMFFPTIQSADLWKQSERYDAYGQEMLRMQDRHERDMLYAPTAEEVVTDVARSHIKSYKELPCTMYQIHWKFRDEIRPRFGVMRGREFLMKDAYTIDLDEKSSRASYYDMMRAYINTFRRMGLAAVPVRADTGPIGGDLSHEFHIVAQTGESKLYYEARLEDIMQQEVDDIDVDDLLSIYAASDELHEEGKGPVPEAELKQARGIEVGHIFYFGQKYTQSLDFQVAGPDNKPIRPHMGSYGIGVSRLLGGIIEASHDEKGIIWPESVAPFKIGLVNLKVSDEACNAACETIYESLRRSDVTVLYDDRDERAGVKFADMDLIGLPWQVCVGPRALKSGVVELKNRKTGEAEELSIDALLGRFTATAKAA